MFPLYCNRCFRRHTLESSLELHISRCGHIICVQCLQHNCPICKKPFSGTIIQKNMPPAMSVYFQAPRNAYRHFQKILKFQYDQERNIVVHLLIQNDKAGNKLRAESGAFDKIQINLRERLEKERERIRKLKEYIAYHERRLEQVRYMTPPITAPPRPRYRNQSLPDSGISSAAYKHIPQLTQTLRARFPVPRSPTLSNSVNSGDDIPPPAQANRKTSRSPQPLIAGHDYSKKTKRHLSFTSE